MGVPGVGDEIFGFIKISNDEALEADRRVMFHVVIVLVPKRLSR
jgi:hypothetical protein